MANPAEGHRRDHCRGRCGRWTDATPGVYHRSTSSLTGRRWVEKRVDRPHMASTCFEACEHTRERPRSISTVPSTERAANDYSAVDVRLFLA
jgi:hypothetical protein